jgi:hypothetical protein
MLCLECVDQLVAEHPDVFEIIKRLADRPRTSPRGAASTSVDSP